MEKILAIGIMGLFLVGTAAFAAAGTDPNDNHYFVVNKDDNSGHWFKGVSFANVTDCSDTDKGAHPDVTGTISPVIASTGNTRTMQDKVHLNGTTREYFCAKDIYPSGIIGFNENKAYVMIYDPAYVPPSK